MQILGLMMLTVLSAAMILLLVISPIPYIYTMVIIERFRLFRGLEYLASLVRRRLLDEIASRNMLKKSLVYVK